MYSLNGKKEKLKVLNSVLFIAKFGNKNDKETVQSINGIVEEFILQ